MFENISNFWSLTVPICRSRAPEFKSGIETEPNRPNGGNKYGFRGSKLPKYKIENIAKHRKKIRYPCVLYGTGVCWKCPCVAKVDVRWASVSWMSGTIRIKWRSQKWISQRYMFFQTSHIWGV